MARRQSAGRRTDYTWFGAADITTGSDLALTTSVLPSNHITLGETGTLMRLRGRARVSLDATAVDEFAVVAVGIIKLTDEAFAAGVGSVPTPHTDVDAEWAWHSYLTIGSGAEASVNQNSLFDSVVIDSKAMRRFKQNEVIAFVAEIADVLDQGGTWDLQFGFRALFGT